ncbi:MAG TPA: aldehyde reductase [Gammaproteobacteria bacterium]|nr:aldehyde reductase [Gammaproteobacteria bacterium]
MKCVCVTGASGYIGSWVVKMLLEEGLTVHGTVRSLENNENNEHLFAMQQAYPKLKLFKADLLDSESFLPALEGCDTLFHTASPVLIVKVANPEEQLLRPAIEGTKGLLSALKKVDCVRRVVLTSSIAAVSKGGNGLGSGKNGAYTEEDWNDNPTHPYYKSKTLAERAAWEIAHKQDHWTMVVINPGLVIGPSLSKRLGMSVRIIRDILKGKYPLFAPNLYFNCVDVRDVAKAHVLAAKSGQGRYLVVNEPISVLSIGKMLKKGFPKRWYLPVWKLPNFVVRCVAPLVGIKQEILRRNLGQSVAYDHQKSLQLGLQYRSLQETILEHAKQLEEDHLV